MNKQEMIGAMIERIQIKLKEVADHYDANDDMEINGILDVARVVVEVQEAVLSATAETASETLSEYIDN